MKKKSKGFIWFNIKCISNNSFKKEYGGLTLKQIWKKEFKADVSEVCSFVDILGYKIKPTCFVFLPLFKIFPVNLGLARFVLNGKEFFNINKVIPNSANLDVYLRPLGFDIDRNPIKAAGDVFAAPFRGVRDATKAIKNIFNPPIPELPQFDAGSDKQRSTPPEINGAENTTNKNGMLPIPLGKIQITPFYSQQPFRVVNYETAVNEYKQAFVLSYDFVRIVSNKRLGYTPTGSYDSTFLTYAESIGGSGFIGFDNIKTISKNETLPYDAVNNVKGEILATGPQNQTKCLIIFQFPQGLYRTINNAGTLERVSIDNSVRIEYKLVSSGTWLSVENLVSAGGSIYVQRLNGSTVTLAPFTPQLNTSYQTGSGGIIVFSSPDDLEIANEPFFKNVGLNFPTPGEYEVRVKYEVPPVLDNAFLGINIVDFQFYVSGNVIKPSLLPDLYQQTLVARASKDLTGTLRQFNMEVITRIPYWNGTNWSLETNTDNPAALIRFVLTDSRVNPRPDSISIIDNDSIVELYNFCSTYNIEIGKLISTETSIESVIDSLADVARAEKSLNFGKYEWFIDKEKDAIDLFTPHNILGNFSWQPFIGEATDCIIASFLDENNNYEATEITVYWYDDAPYLTPKSGTSIADYNAEKRNYDYVTSAAMAWFQAVYDLANIQLRRNVYEFNINLQLFVRNINDRVLISNICDLKNTYSGHIKEIKFDGLGQIIGFVFSDNVELLAGETYTIRIRSHIESGSIITEKINTFTAAVVSDDTVTKEVSLQTPQADDGSIQQAGYITGVNDTLYYDGDYFEIGVGKIKDCIIKNIQKNDDLTATVTAVDYGNSAYWSAVYKTYPGS